VCKRPNSSVVEPKTVRLAAEARPLWRTSRFDIYCVRCLQPLSDSPLRIIRRVNGKKSVSLTERARAVSTTFRCSFQRWLRGLSIPFDLPPLGTPPSRVIPGTGSERQQSSQEARLFSVALAGFDQRLSLCPATRPQDQVEITDQMSADTTSQKTKGEIRRRALGLSFCRDHVPWTGEVKVRTKMAGPDHNASLRIFAPIPSAPDSDF
jgi:hypothetical protein